MNDTPKPQAPFALDIDFGEALARFAQTKPEEVEPPPGKERKTVRATVVESKSRVKGPKRDASRR